MQSSLRGRSTWSASCATTGKTGCRSRRIEKHRRISGLGSGEVLERWRLGQRLFVGTMDRDGAEEFEETKAGEGTKPRRSASRSALARGHYHGLVFRLGDDGTCRQHT